MRHINSRLLNRLLCGCLIAVLAAPAGAEEATEIKQEWQPSTLSDKTLAKVNAGVEDYFKCLNDETLKHVQDKDDSRRVTDLILGNCEKRLGAVKEAFDAEKVPANLSERYLRSKRSRGAQQVVKVVMQAQALRHAETHP